MSKRSLVPIDSIKREIRNIASSIHLPPDERIRNIFNYMKEQVTLHGYHLHDLESDDAFWLEISVTFKDIPAFYELDADYRLIKPLLGDALTKDMLNSSKLISKPVDKFYTYMGKGHPNYGKSLKILYARMLKIESESPKTTTSTSASSTTSTTSQPSKPSFPKFRSSSPQTTSTTSTTTTSTSKSTTLPPFRPFTPNTTSTHTTSTTSTTSVTNRTTSSGHARLQPQEQPRIQVKSNPSHPMGNVLKVDDTLGEPYKFISSLQIDYSAAVMFSFTFTICKDAPKTLEIKEEITNSQLSIIHNEDKKRIEDNVDVENLSNIHKFYVRNDEGGVLYIYCVSRKNFIIRVECKKLVLLLVLAKTRKTPLSGGIVTPLAYTKRADVPSLDFTRFSSIHHITEEMTYRKFCWYNELKVNDKGQVTLIVLSKMEELKQPIIVGTKKGLNIEELKDILLNEKGRFTDINRQELTKGGKDVLFEEVYYSNTFYLDYTVEVKGAPDIGVRVGNALRTDYLLNVITLSLRERIRKDKKISDVYLYSLVHYRHKEKENDQGYYIMIMENRRLPKLEFGLEFDELMSYTMIKDIRLEVNTIPKPRSNLQAEDKYEFIFMDNDSTEEKDIFYIQMIRNVFDFDDDDMVVVSEYVRTSRYCGFTYPDLTQSLYRASFELEKEVHIYKESNVETKQLLDGVVLEKFARSNYLMIYNTGNAFHERKKFNYIFYRYDEKGDFARIFLLKVNPLMKEPYCDEVRIPGLRWNSITYITVLSTYKQFVDIPILCIRTTNGNIYRIVMKSYTDELPECRKHDISSSLVTKLLSEMTLSQVKDDHDIHLSNDLQVMDLSCGSCNARNVRLYKDKKVKKDEVTQGETKTLFCSELCHTIYHYTTKFQ